jgi:RHS repeat-associated protein
MTNASQVIVWDLITDPYGRQHSLTATSPRTENPRFAGQYYDAESGYNYNYFRDYDPKTGRYLQSDPIGLDGGINTYRYAEANPIKYTDRLGLKVLACKRKADLPWPLSMENHYWLKTDTYEAGMGGNGGQVPAQEGRSDWPYSSTQTVDHSGQSSASNAFCQEIPKVNESCINDIIKPGQPTGRWTPLNQCHSFVNDAIDKCKTLP